MGPIIRTCSAAVALLLLPVVAQARVAPSPLADYARGRIATDQGEAARFLAAALAGAPEDRVVALRAWRAALVAGDYRLSLRAAQALDRLAILPDDAQLLLLIAALKDGDTAEARRRADDIARDSGLDFIAPQLREWIELRGDPAPPSAARNDYAQESGALAALARGRTGDGIAAVRTLWTLDPYRAQSLRIAAAATLAKRGDRAGALGLLVADTRSTAAARDRIARRRPLGVEVDRPLAGIAFVLARLAGDLIVEGAGASALGFARLAQFADPGNARIALTTAGALLAAKRPELALAAIEPGLDDPLYGDDARSLRIELLETLGRFDEAEAAAVARGTQSANDAARLGDMAMRRGKFDAAARRFDEALAMGEGAKAWALWHAAGNAHLLAGNWAKAKPALERAYALAPDQPLVLNSLGFALVDVGGDAARGKALIERAAALQPGNASIIDSQGWAALRTGDVPRAIAALERARLLEPLQAEIGEHLGDAYWAAGRRIDARHAWAAASLTADEARAARLAGKLDKGLP